MIKTQSRFNKVIAGGIIIILLVLFVSVIKNKNGDCNYLNSDATWHTLLTVTAYDQTSWKIHKFLPIVTLGSEDDKFIKWGLTAPDDKGNFYYTSFSPATFVIPYLFFKIFNTPIAESSLCNLNSILFAVSAFLWYVFLIKIFGKQSAVIPLIGSIIYICTPEILHGMGIVYWAQSVFQVAFLIQLLAFYCYKFEKSKKSRVLFYVFCVLNPYIEWTGFVANMGFAVAEYLTIRKIDKKNALIECAKVVLFTFVSFLLFCLHYLLVCDVESFFSIVYRRFFARNAASRFGEFPLLIRGYITSFAWLWVSLLLLVILNLKKFKKCVINNKLVLLVLLVPVFENVLMLQHAESYTYDRMKVVFPLSFVMCSLLSNLLNVYENRKRTTFVYAIIFVFCAANVFYYMHNQRYIWNIDYKVKNERFAQYILDNYPNSILALEKGFGVRGYINMLFKRGIYERETLEDIEKIAKMKNKKYAIYVSGINHPWNMYELTGAWITDLSTDEKYFLRANNERVQSGK